MLCKATKNCMRTITVCCITMAAVCLILSLTIIYQMRYERQQHEKQVGIMVEQYITLVQSVEKIEADELRKFHKANWKVKPTKSGK